MLKISQAILMTKDRYAPMPIEDIMTTKVLTITPKHTVGEMSKIFKSMSLHHLLVVENNKLLGVVTDREVLKVISPFINTKHETARDKLTLSYTAQQLMSKKLITIGPKASIREAGRLLLENKIYLLPVINEDETLIGVLSWKDVLQHIIN